MKDDNRRHPFRRSSQDRDEVRHVPDTPQTRSPSYALAFADPDFMCAQANPGRHIPSQGDRVVE